MRVKCLAQEHNTNGLSRAQTWALWFGVHIYSALTIRAPHLPLTEGYFLQFVSGFPVNLVVCIALVVGKGHFERIIKFFFLLFLFYPKHQLGFEPKQLNHSKIFFT